MKGLLEFLALPLSLPIPPIWDYVIGIVIGELAFQVAYSFAGRFGNSSQERRALHWLIRFPVYFVTWLIICALVYIVNFIKSNWIWVLVVLGTATITAIIILCVRKARRIKENAST